MNERNLKEELIEIKRVFKKDKDFKKYYVNGAIGGFRNKYDFRLTFFDLETNDLVIKSDPIKFDKNLTQEEKFERLRKLEFQNTLVCELIITEEAVRELYAFLGKELKKFESLKEVNEVGFHF